MTLRKRGAEPQDAHRRLDGHITPEDPPETGEVEGLEPGTGTTGDGRPVAPAGDRED